LQSSLGCLGSVSKAGSQVSLLEGQSRSSGIQAQKLKNLGYQPPKYGC
jgi:hypothetical protein